MNQIDKILADVKRRYNDNLKAEEMAHTGHFGSAAKEDYDLLSFIESLEKEQEGLHFTPLGRLIQKLPWNDSTNSYAKKLVDCLVREGYIKDAQIVQGIVSYKNGNNIPMATMDEVHIQFNDERMLKKERENKGYDESYLKEKIALATKNGSWRESPEKEKSEIPSNSPSVDEAAEEYARSSDFQRTETEAFKAGAEWMAGQGVNLKCWIARDERSGDESDLYIGQQKPRRLPGTSPGFGMWCDYGEFMALPSDMFPELTYSDEPIEVELIIRKK